MMAAKAKEKKAEKKKTNKIDIDVWSRGTRSIGALCGGTHGHFVRKKCFANKGEASLAAIMPTEYRTFIEYCGSDVDCIWVCCRGLRPNETHGSRRNRR